MLTVWSLPKRSARFYGEYVGQNGQTHAKPQKLLSLVPHISLTPFHGGVANRHSATAPQLSYHMRRGLSTPPTYFIF